MLSTSLLILAGGAVVALAAEHQVMVGPGLTYSPKTLNAAAGDVVSFMFMGGMHSATQSSLTNPCSSSGGFDSGIKAVGTSSDYPTYNFTLKDTNPVYVYCSQGNHCKEGMVMAINVGESDFAAFQAAATGGAAPSGSASSAAMSMTSSMGASASSAASAASSGASSASSAASSAASAAASATSKAAAASMAVPVTGMLALVAGVFGVLL